MTEPRRRYVRFTLAAAGALVIAAITLVVYLKSDLLSDRIPSSGSGSGMLTAPSTGSEGDSGTMSMHDRPRPLPDLEFEDGDGDPRTLSDFRGRVVLLNVWATWCTPCRHEMPTLDRLQAELGGKGFEVVALSIDRAGAGVVDTFYRETGVTHLAKYIDASGKAARDLNTPGLPTTLLVDRMGREVGRRVGPAEWDSPDMKAFIQTQVAKETN